MTPGVAGRERTTTGRKKIAAAIQQFSWRNYSQAPTIIAGSVPDTHGVSQKKSLFGANLKYSGPLFWNVKRA